MGFFGYLDRVRYKFAQDARRLHGMDSHKKAQKSRKNGQKSTFFGHLWRDVVAIWSLRR